MDPLTALGVASNIISVIDFSAKLASALRKAYAAAKGASEELDDISYLITA